MDAVNLSLPAATAAIEEHERESRAFYRLAHSRTGLQRQSCLNRAQHHAMRAQAFREHVGEG